MDVDYLLKGAVEEPASGEGNEEHESASLYGGNSRFVKSVQYKFPVIYKGQETDKFGVTGKKRDLEL